MKAIDDSTLMAYLDGELDEGTAREVEALVASDAQLDATIQGFRQSDALLRTAFNHVMFGTSPSTALPEELNLEKARKRKSVRPWAPLPVAMAASLAILLIGGITGYAMLDSLVEREFERHALIKEKDKQAMTRARANALEREISGTKVSWTNPDSGNSGTMIPVQTWRTKTGRYCREFQESITIDGTDRVERGVACRADDGFWKVRLRYFPD